MTFVNLHTHDCKGSVRDAIATPDGICKRIKELGQTTYAITNHGSTSSLLTHYKLAKKYGLKFIFGLEAYICDDITIHDKYDYKHLCLFAKDVTGYKNILKMATISYHDGFYQKPRIDWSILMEHKDGLVISSACLGGIFGLHKEDGTYDEQAIYEVAKKYKAAFGNDFYVELQTNQMKDQLTLNPILVRIAKELQLQLVATCDAHYVYKEDAKAHRAWLNIETNKGDENGYYQTDDFFLHSEDEVRANLDYLGSAVVEESIRNTNEIADKCSNVEIKFGEDNFPVFKCDNQVEKVKEICRKGWKAKINGHIPKDKQKPYLDRFLHEMDILTKANYLNMMLITWDYMNYGKSIGIRFGCGRGSVGSSLVAYLMDLTKVDPVKYNLTFSRFCNLSRVTTADKVILSSARET